MGFINSFFVLALLGCSSQQTLSSPAYSDAGSWPGKIVQVECANEYGMESRIIQSLGEFPVRGIQVRHTSCCMYFEANLAYYYKHQYSEIEYRLRATPGVISVSFK